MVKPIIAGNWKMYKTPSEGLSFVGDVNKMILDIERSQVIFCPPFPTLFAVKDQEKPSCTAIGAQNCHWEDEGAFTGEISVNMLIDSKVDYVILGHSERRHVFNEPDEWINNKVLKVISSGLDAMLCVGETLEERDGNQTEEVLKRQLEFGLKSVSDLKSIIIAYEPVWAIGTGRTAVPAQAQEAHSMIRKYLTGKYSQDDLDQLRILYGGSVKPDNAVDLIKTPGVDGFLIGGASLKVDSFVSIIKSVETNYTRN